MRACTSTTPNPTTRPDEGRRPDHAGRRGGEPELILLVEDSPTQALRTLVVLEEAGWRVAVCPDGASAPATAAATRPDLILLDIHLPGLSGLEVAERLKADPVLAGIPIIFLTSVYEEFEDVVRGLDQGADDYIFKTVRDEMLVARVRANLRAKRTQRELARLARLLLSVNRVGSQLAGILDLPALLDSSCRMLHEEIDGASVNVYLANGGELVLSAAAGPFAKALMDDPPRLPRAGDSLVAACVREGRMLQGALLADDPRSHLREAWARSVVALPLPAAGEAAGALEIAGASPLAFDETDKLVVGTIADMLGVGVHNLRLFRRMEDLAMSDGLTGLKNRRAILGNLEGEWSRVRRHGRPLAVISMDIDFFKAINDGHGHAVGDEAIKAVGDVLRREVRREDFAGRLGGDEFLVVLPDTDRAGALELAERIRASAEGLAIDPLDSGPPISLSLSLGVASWPEDEAHSPDELLRASDEALYRAKAAGRNRVSD
jgi:two-component system cell cycle response regulator